MSRIPLVERVPPDYRRLFLFFGEDGFRGIICVDGEQCLNCGENQKPEGETRGNYLDWMQEAVGRIRAELQELEP